MDDVRDRLQRASGYVTVPERPFERLIEKRDRDRRRSRVASAVLAGVVAIGVVGGAMTMLSRLGKEPRRAAVGGLALQPGQYFYLRIQSSEEKVDGHIRDLETWWAIDGSGEVRNRSTRQDKYPTPRSGRYGPGAFPVDITMSDDLSADPEELLAQLRQDLWASQSVDQPEGLWDVISHLLLEAPNAAPDVRAALFEVVKDLPRVITIEGAHDRLERDAVVLEFSASEITWTMHFDPDTHQLIAWTSVYAGGSASWIVLESAIVGSRGERPDGDDWLVPPLPPGLPP